ncbi:MAG: DNA polymerase III subunit delta [Candidatus Magasanikbacteria bacterium]|nr:DNA polymerase III subunit delta [Candidatus Magasanikbacteria bacterium]
MIIFLYGEDSFRSREHLKKMIKKFKKERDPNGYNTFVIDLEKNDKDNVIEQILTPPFLAEKKMVILENLIKHGNDDLLKNILNRIEEKDLPEENVLIFWESTDKFRKKLQKKLFFRLSKEKFSQNFSLLQGSQLSAWISDQIEQRNAKIEKEAISYLLKHCYSDMWFLNSLIDQISAYKSDEIIGVRDVMLFLDEKIDDNIFNLVDAIIARNAKDVFKMIREQYKNGKEPQYVFAMVLRQIRILIILRDLFERDSNMNSRDMSAQTKLHPFVVKKSLTFVKRYNLHELKSIYDDLLQLDVRIKTGQEKADVLVDFFVNKYCFSS